MFASVTAVILWASSVALNAQCGCATEQVVEHYDDGSSWVGAIAEFDERSVGVYTAPDGAMTVELP